MNFNEFKKLIENIPYCDNIKYKRAIMWVHPEHLPLGVVSIGDGAGGVIKIPGRALNSFGHKVPVIAIGTDAFSYHGKISDIVLPATVESIPPGAFAGCSGLKRITIPKKIKAIRERTFEGCNNLEDVYYEGTPEEWEKINIIHHKYEAEFGPLIPGTPVQKIKAERLLRVPGNEALINANIHFRCEFSDFENNSVFKITSDGKNVADLFKVI